MLLAKICKLACTLNSNYENLSKYAIFQHVAHYRIAFDLAVQNYQGINIYVFGSNSDTSTIYGIFVSTRTDNLSSAVYPIYDNMSIYKSSVSVGGWDIHFTSDFGFDVDHYVLERI